MELAHIGLILLIIGLVVGGLYILDRKRTAAIKQMADELGYVFSEHPKQMLPGSLWRFSLFNRGRSRRSRNLIQKETDGVTVSVMEYHYSTGSGKNRRNHSQTVVVIQSSQLALPQFNLSPENIFHKVGRMLGFQDLNFESHPNFSKRYRLVGDDENSIRDCFHEGVLNFVESQNKLCMEGDRSIFICYHAGRLKSPKTWSQLIATGFRAYEHLSLLA